MVNSVRATRFTILVLVGMELLLLQGCRSVYDFEERFYYFTLLLCAGVATVVTLSEKLLGQFENKMLTTHLDELYHIAATTLMLVSSILFLISVISNRCDGTVDEFARRLFAGIMGFFTAFVMGYMVWVLLRDEEKILE